MFLISNLISAVAELLNILLTVYMWIVIIRALITWVNPDPYNPVVQFLYRATDPVLNPVRRILPGYGMGIDFSPFVVILGIIFVQRFLVASLYQLALRIQ